MAQTKFWCTSSGRIELTMTLEQAHTAHHTGRCDEDVKAVSGEPDIQAQLDKINPKLLASELKDYGAWDGVERADHEQNKQRILWLAAGGYL